MRAHVSLSQKPKEMEYRETAWMLEFDELMVVRRDIYIQRSDQFQLATRVYGRFPIHGKWPSSGLRSKCFTRQLVAQEWPLDDFITSPHVFVWWPFRS